MLRIKGTNIVYMVIVVLALIASGTFISGVSTESFKLFLRVTGRLAVCLFVISFGAGVLQSPIKANWARYLLRNRRYFGMSTAITLWVHLSAIVTLALQNPEWYAAEAPLFITIPGGMAFMLVGVMALTSNNAAQKKLGMKAWKTLHIMSSYYLWAIFLFEYVLIIFLVPEYLKTMLFPSLAYLLFSILLLLLMVRLGKERILTLIK